MRRGFKRALIVLGFIVAVAASLWMAHQAPVAYAAPSYNPLRGDPCAVNLRQLAFINLAASGQPIAGTAGKQTYICAFQLVTATAQNIALVEGTGTTCGTNTVGMAGGNTAATGWNLGVNGQVLITGTPNAWILATATAGDNVCLLLSSTGQTSGFMQYVQQ